MIGFILINISLYEPIYGGMVPDYKEQERLIDQLKEGSKDAFHSLFNSYAPKIHAFAFSYLGNNADAEELLQDLFLKIWEMRATLDSSKNIKSFLFKVCVNLIYDFIRRKNIERAYIGYAGQMDHTTADSTWHEVIYNDMLANLNILVTTMPEQRQLIFRLSKEQGLTNEEIALQLNLSKRTVENQLYRALSYLKEKIGQGTLTGILFFYLHCS